MERPPGSARTPGSPVLPPESPAGIFRFDHNGYITGTNRKVTEWLGYGNSELTGRKFDELLDGAGRFFHQTQIEPMLSLQGEIEEVYLSLRDKSGNAVPVLLNALRTRQGDAVVTEYIIFRMARRARLEDELLHAKKLAEQASDAKTKFLGMMSHELRTPLQMISLGNQLLISGEPGPITESQKELLDASEAATQSVTTLIEDILEFAQMQAGPMKFAQEDVPVGRAITRAERLILPRIEQAHLIYRRGEIDEDLNVRCDPKRLQQILLNFLNNALKFTPAGGSITVSARSSEVYTVIEVTDSGCGIAPDQMQRVFEPFVQLSAPLAASTKAGVGLGLAICRDLARAMGGDVFVKSTINVGSTFGVALPAR